jgi:hypothetical protein
MRSVITLVATLVAVACGSTSAPTPVGDAVNGVWKGSSGSTAMTVDIHSIGESGQILGSGTMTTGGGARSVLVEGAFVSPDMSLHLVDTGYSVFFTGKVSGRTMAGALQGSAAGFTGQQITLSRQ